MSEVNNKNKALELPEDGPLSPTPRNEFEEYLLESMIEKGLSGQELVKKFNEAKTNAGWTIFRPIKENKPKQ